MIQSDIPDDIVRLIVEHHNRHGDENITTVRTIIYTGATGTEYTAYLVRVGENSSRMSIVESVFTDSNGNRYISEIDHSLYRCERAMIAGLGRVSNYDEGCDL